MNNHDIIKIPVPIVKTHKHWRDVPSFPSMLRAGPSGRSPFISLTLRRPLRLKCDYRAVPAASSASDCRVSTRARMLCLDVTELGDRGGSRSVLPGDLNASDARQQNTGDFIRGYRAREMDDCTK